MWPYTLHYSFRFYSNYKGVPLEGFNKGRLKSDIHLKTDSSDYYMENEFKNEKGENSSKETIKKATVTVQTRDTG